MHGKILSQHLLRKTELDDLDVLSDIVGTRTVKYRMWIIQMHSRILLQLLLRETELDDLDAWLNTVTTLTEENITG